MNELPQNRPGDRKAPGGGAATPPVGSRALGLYPRRAAVQASAAVPAVLRQGAPNEGEPMNAMPEVLPEGVTPPPQAFNFARHLLDCNTGRPDKPAFADDAGRVTYGAIGDRARRLAAGLRALGIKREERVLLLMQDTTDWPACFLGAIYAGIVPVAVNTLLTADDYAYMLEHCRAQAVLASGALLPALKAALTKSDHEVHRSWYRARSPRSTSEKWSWKASWNSMRRCLGQHRPMPTTRASGCTPRAPPAGPRVRCTRMPTRTGPASSTPRPSCG